MKNKKMHSDYPMFRPVKPVTNYNQNTDSHKISDFLVNVFMCSLWLLKRFTQKEWHVFHVNLFTLSITTTVGDFRLFFSSPQHANFPKVKDV